MERRFPVVNVHDPTQMPECLISLLDSSDANKVWSWLPCGVACKAGELVELQSSLAGSMWGTSSTNLAATSCGGGLVRSGSQFVLNDLFGRVAQARDASGALVASATFDTFGVQRGGSGSFTAGIVRKTYGGNNEDGLKSFSASRAVSFRSLGDKPSDYQCTDKRKCDWWMPPLACNALRSEVCRNCWGLCEAWCENTFPDNPMNGRCLRACKARYSRCMVVSGVAF